VGAEIVGACERFGVFQVVDHGVPLDLRAELRAAAVEFFALPDREKAAIAMVHGGAAWRGWFGVGGELTSGVPDGKEGVYFGTELGPDDPRVRAGTPLHGPNLFPVRPPDLRRLVLRWMDEVTEVGRRVLDGMARGLGLAPDWFDRWCAEPTVLFRMFHYPPAPDGTAGSWGVAEHTDYGLLTLLAQDLAGGLEGRVPIDPADPRAGSAWVPIPPVDDAFVCNLGDMLERMTGGRFRSTPHRVRLPESDRYSFPLFLDPGWDVVVHPLPGHEPDPDRSRDAGDRWDGASVFDRSGTYGDYLPEKVGRVSPDLFRSALVDGDPAPTERP
jgi:isopenicillin N synthase-like dioxygenase